MTIGLQAHHELRLSRHIAAAKPGHLGLSYIRTVKYSFKIPGQGPKGPHLCLVYEPMREPLWLLQRRMSDGIYSLELLGYTVKFLLIGLDYLHNECEDTYRCAQSPLLHYAHYISLRFETRKCASQSSSLDDVVGDEIKSPSPRKIFPGYHLLVP
jgi:serine/threonine-protein kinase SRPK3